MSVLPEAGIGEEIEVGPLEAGQPLETGGWLSRAQKVVSGKLTYAFGDQIVFSFGNLVVMALISRHVARDLGMYILTQRSMDVMLQLCNVFIWAPFVYNMPAMAEEKRRQYFGSVAMHQVVACSLAGLAMLGMTMWAHTPQRGIYHGTFSALVFTCSGLMFREFTRRMYFAEMRFREAFWTDVATNGLQIVLVETLYLRGMLTVQNTLWMLSLGADVVSLWWVAQEVKRMSFSLRAARADLKENLKLGRWFFGSNMVFTVSSQSNPWVLSVMGGGASVGAYAVCESVVNIPRVALTSVQNIMAPMMARAFTEGGKPSLAKMVKKLDGMLLAGALAFAVGIVTFGPWVAKVIFHSRPENARTILVLLSLNLIAFASTLPQSYGLSAVGKAGKTFYANLTGLAMQVTVSLWLIHTLHVAGAAAAMLVGSVTVAAVRGYFYMREMKTV